MNDLYVVFVSDLNYDRNKIVGIFDNSKTATMVKEAKQRLLAYDNKQYTYQVYVKEYPLNKFPDDVANMQAELLRIENGQKPKPMRRYNRIK